MILRRQYIGAKRGAEDVDRSLIYYSAVVEECCVRAEAGPVRAGGQQASKNVGISNIYRGENPLRRISKGSRATIVVPGLVDPKW